MLSDYIEQIDSNFLLETKWTNDSVKVIEKNLDRVGQKVLSLRDTEVKNSLVLDRGMFASFKGKDVHIMKYDPVNKMITDFMISKEALKNLKKVA